MGQNYIEGVRYKATAFLLIFLTSCVYLTWDRGCSSRTFNFGVVVKKKGIFEGIFIKSWPPGLRRNWQVKLNHQTKFLGNFQSSLICDMVIYAHDYTVDLGCGLVQDKTCPTYWKGMPVDL